MAHLDSGSVNHEGLNAGLPTLIPFSFPGQLPPAERVTDEYYQRAIQNALSLLQRGWLFPAFTSHEAAADASRFISNQGEDPHHNTPYGLIEALSNWRGGHKAGAGGF